MNKNKERAKEIFMDLYNRYSYIKDYDDKRGIQDLMTALYEHTDYNHPYLYTELYMDKKYETWNERNAFSIGEDYEDFINENNDLLKYKLYNFYSLDTKYEDKHDSYVPNMKTILSNFFEGTDTGLYDLFNSMQDNILMLFKNGSGQAFYDAEYDKNYVIIGKDYVFDNMVALAHEMGHAYRDHLFKKRHITHDIDERLKSEIFSEVVELLFTKYLIDNDIYASDASNWLIRYNNGLIESTREFLDKNFVKNDGSSTLLDFTYLFGKIIAHDYINSNISLKDLFIYIENTNVIDIIKNINFDNVVNSITKNYCLKKQ